MIKKVMTVVAAMIFLLFLCVEMKPPEIHSSQIFSTSEQTEITLHVLTNTFLDVDEDELAAEIVAMDQSVNGVRENSVYRLYLYRTRVHLRRSWEYDMLNCDKNGAIIRCEERDN